MGCAGHERPVGIVEQAKQERKKKSCEDKLHPADNTIPVNFGDEVSRRTDEYNIKLFPADNDKNPHNTMSDICLRSLILGAIFS